MQEQEHEKEEEQKQEKEEQEQDEQKQEQVQEPTCIWPPRILNCPPLKMPAAPPPWELIVPDHPPPNSCTLCLRSLEFIWEDKRPVI